MVRLVLNKGTIANDGTGDTLRTAATKIENNFNEIYTKLGDGNSLLSDIDFDNDTISFLFTGGKKTTIFAEEPTVTQRSVKFPDYTGSVVVDSASQTLLNKTLTSPILTTPQINDSVGDHQYIFGVSELTGDRIINLPLLTDSDTFVFANHTETLTNKTLQSPVINDPRIVDTIFDSSGNELISFVANNSAVSFVEIENKATASPVGRAVVRGAGEANTNLTLEGTGTNGGVLINDRMVVTLETKTSAGNITGAVPLTTINIATPASHTLQDGVIGQSGEIKYILNTGAGAQTINEDNNIVEYTSIVLSQNASVMLVWLSPNWYVLNTNGTVTLNT